MAYTVPDETLRKAATAAEREVGEAIKQLSRSTRGREAMKACVELIDKSAGLDSRNKDAIETLMKWSEAFTGTVLDGLRSALSHA